MKIEWKPVKNFSTGRSGYKTEAIVIHIAEGWLAGGYSWFNNAESKVSSHYMIGKSGEIWQFVKDEDTAWHTGSPSNPTWSKLKNNINPNLYTIGIEHEGFTGELFTNEMYEATSSLLAELSQKWQIQLSRDTVIGHNQINQTSRDRCPGTGVDLNKLINLAISKLKEDPNMIKELQQKVSELEINLLNLQNQVQSLLNENSALKNRITENKNMYENDIRNLEESITSKLSDNETLINLTNQKNSLAKEVRTLQNTQSELNNKISSLENENKSLKKQLNTNNTNNTTNPTKDTFFNLISSWFK